MQSSKPVPGGGTDLLSIPSPDESDYVAVAKWVSRDRVEVVMGRSAVGADTARPHPCGLDPVTLSFELVRRRFHLPFALPTWAASFVWLFLCTMVAMSNSSSCTNTMQVGPQLGKSAPCSDSGPRFASDGGDNSTMTAFTRSIWRC